MIVKNSGQCTIFKQGFVSKKGGGYYCCKEVVVNLCCKDIMTLPLNFVDL